MKHPFFSPVDELLFESRIVHISGVINSELAHKVNEKLLALEKTDPKKPIQIFIDSPGGEINSGFSIYDTARFIQPEVFTIVAGLAASMGSLIALCAKKENRYSLPNSKFLIHQPLISGMLQGPASDLEIHAKEILRTKQKIIEIYSKETGKSLKEIAEATDRDYWMTAEEALSFGLISKIVTKRSDVPSRA